MTESCDAVVIGGGFYGLYLAEYLAKQARRVILFERGAGLMQRASYSNQARVHNGYHYPRSLLTAVRSRVNFPRFVKEFHPAVESMFEKVYAVSRRMSKVTADQFYLSMQRIGAPVRPAPKKIADLFDPGYIEAAFLTREYAFNSTVLCELIAERARRSRVDIRLQSDVKAVRAEPGGGVRVEVESAGGMISVSADHVFCCAYAQLNAPAVDCGLPHVALKHELTEMALVEVPVALRGLGITVMDGPFFSLMPFPARGLFTMSHVRYTPHAHWYDGKGEYHPAYAIHAQAEKRTAFPHMVRDVARYLPAAAGCRYRDSLWEVKTLLPRSETDDSRPILFRPDFGLPGYHLVMGGKIDNVYDIADVIGQKFGWFKG